MVEEGESVFTVGVRAGDPSGVPETALVEDDDPVPVEIHLVLPHPRVSHTGVEEEDGRAFTGGPVVDVADIDLQKT